MKQKPCPLTIPFLLLLLLLVFVPAIFRVDREQQEEGRRRLEESLRLSAMDCYASEGVYPPTLDYLKEKYHIQIDEERYGVFYEIFADNLMPTITVVTVE